MALVARRPEMWIACAGIAIFGLVSVTVAGAFVNHVPEHLEVAVENVRAEAGSDLGHPEAGLEQGRQDEMTTLAAETEAALLKLGALHDENRLLVRERDALIARATAMELEIGRVERESEQARVESQSILQEMEGLKLEVEDLQRQRDRMDESLTSAQQKVLALEEELKAKTGQLNASGAELSEVKQALALREADVIRHMQELSSLERRLEEARHPKDRRENEAPVASAGGSARTSPERGQAAGSAVPVSAAGFVQALGERIVRTLSAETLSLDDKRDALLELLRDSIDLGEFSHAVLGSHWEAATGAQQRDYEALFEGYILRPIIRMVGQDRIREFRVVGSKGLGSHETQVDTRVTTQSGTGLDWNWIVRQKDERHQIVDLKSHGVSLVAVYRSELGSYLSNKGLEALIESLRSVELGPG